MSACGYCGGLLILEREDPRDQPVLKCFHCARYAATRRAHEEPTRQIDGPGREQWRRSKAKSKKAKSVS